MKKSFITMLLFYLVLPFQSKADNTNIEALDNAIYITPVTITAGTQHVLSVKMKNAVVAQGFSFKLYLPTGISFVTDGEGNAVASPTENRKSGGTFDYRPTIEEDGALYMYVNIEGGEFTGDKGEVATVTVSVSEEMAAGDYPLLIKNIRITRPDDMYNYPKISLVETTISISEPNDGRIKFYETSTTLPTYTAGTKADVTMYRTIKANQWSTIVLPFNLTSANAKAVFGTDVQFAKFKGYTIDYGEDEENVTPLGITINLSEYTIPTRGNLAGGTPVLIKTSKDITGFQLDNVTLTAGVTDENNTDTDYGLAGKLTGTLMKSVIPADGLFISDNKFWYSTGKTNIKAFRCWFELGAVLGKDTDFGSRVLLNFLEDSETTGISTMHHSECIMHNKIYDLQGRRVMKPVKGLYIKNGRKEVVR